MPAARYECQLEPELLQKAVNELNEPDDNERRLSEIDKLRERFLEEQSEYELLRTDDAFILRFLRAKKFNQDKAYATLVNYHQKRKSIPEVYDKVDNPEALTGLLNYGVASCINQKASDGSTIMIYRPGVVPPETSFFDQLAVSLLFIEHLLEDETVQINGITTITDYTGVGLSFIKQCTPYAMKAMFGITDAMPLRLKTLNLVNEFTIFSVVFAIAKPFMKEKMQKRMQLHGANFTTLHKQIDPKGLPPFLAGTGPDLDIMGWKKRILSTDGYGEETAL